MQRSFTSLGLERLGDRFKLVGTEVQAGLRPMRDYREELNRQERQLQQIIRTQDRTTDEYRQAAEQLIEVRGELQRVGTAADNVGRRMQTAGAALTVGLTLPIIGMATASTMAANEFNKGMANVASLIPGNTERVKELKQGVLDLALSSGTMATELSSGLYQVVSAFGDTSDSMAILEQANKAAIAGVSTSTDAINLLSAVTKGYGDTSFEAVQKVSDLALLTVRLGQTDFPALAGSVGKTVPVFTAIGGQVEDLFGAFATLTGVTGNTAEVATQLQNVFKAFLNPNELMTQALQKNGFATGKLAVEQLGLQGALELVAAASGGNDAVLAKMLGTSEALTAVLALTGNQADVFTEKLGEMRNGAGATEEALAEQTSGINANGRAMEELKAIANVLAIQLGDGLAPAVTEVLKRLMPLIDKVVEAASRFANADEKTQMWIITIVGLVAALGPLTTLLGTVIRLGSSAATTITTLSTAFTAARTSGVLLSGTLAAMAGPAGLLLAVGTAAGIAAGYMIKLANDTKTAYDTIDQLQRNTQANLNQLYGPNGNLIGIMQSTVDDITAQQLPSLRSQADIMRRQMEGLWASGNHAASHEMRDRLHAVNEEIARLENHAGAAQARINQLQTEGRALVQAMQPLPPLTTASGAAIQGATLEANGLASALNGATVQTVSLGNATGRTTAEVIEAEGSLARLRQDLQKATEERDKATTDSGRAAAQARMNALKTEIDRLEGNLQRAGTAEGSLARLREDLQKAQLQRDNATTDSARKAAQERINTLQAEINRLEGSLQQAGAAEGSLARLREQLQQEQTRRDQAATQEARQQSQNRIRDLEAEIARIEASLAESDPLAPARAWTERLTAEVQLGLKRQGDAMELLKPRADELRDELRRLHQEGEHGSDAYKLAAEKLGILEAAMRSITGTATTLQDRLEELQRQPRDLSGLPIAAQLGARAARAAEAGQDFTPTNPLGAADAFVRDRDAILSDTRASDGAQALRAAENAARAALRAQRQYQQSRQEGLKLETDAAAKLKAVQDELDATMLEAQTRATLLGEVVDMNAVRTEALARAIIRLRSEGFEPTTGALAAYVAEYQTLTATLELPFSFALEEGAKTATEGLLEFYGQLVETVKLQGDLGLETESYRGVLEEAIAVLMIHLETLESTDVAYLQVLRTIGQLRGELGGLSMDWQNFPDFSLQGGDKSATDGLLEFYSGLLKLRDAQKALGLEVTDYGGILEEALDIYERQLGTLDETSDEYLRLAAAIVQARESLRDFRSEQLERTPGFASAAPVGEQDPTKALMGFYAGLLETNRLQKQFGIETESTKGILEEAIDVLTIQLGAIDESDASYNALLQTLIRLRGELQGMSTDISGMSLAAESKTAAAGVLEYYQGLLATVAVQRELGLETESYAGVLAEAIEMLEAQLALLDATDADYLRLAQTLVQLRGEQDSAGDSIQAFIDRLKGIEGTGPTALEALSESIIAFREETELSEEQLQMLELLLSRIGRLNALDRQKVAAEEYRKAVKETLDVVVAWTVAIGGGVAALLDLANGSEDAFSSIGKLGAGIADVIGLATGIPGLGQAFQAVWGVIGSILGDLSNGLAQVKREIADVQRGFSLIDVSSLVKTKQQSRGGLLGFLGFTKAVVDQEASEFGLSIARSLEQGFMSGMQRGMQAFLDGGSLADMEFAIQEGIYSGVNQAMLAAVVEGGVIQAILGPKLLELTKAISEGYKTGNYSYAQGLVREIQATVPGLVAELAPILSSFRSMKPQAPGALENVSNPTGISVPIAPIAVMAAPAWVADMGGHISKFGEFTQALLGAMRGGGSNAALSNLAFSGSGGGWDARD